MPPWFGPPRGTLPAALPLDRVLVRTEQVAVCFTRLAAYPTGFELDIVAMAAHQNAKLGQLLAHAHRLSYHDTEAEGIPPEMLRVGMQFADGSKATNTAGHHPTKEPPPGPIMRPGGGGGSQGNFAHTLWVWPLPPPGPLVLACEWPALAIPLTRWETDAQAILDGATRAQVIFSDEHLPKWPPDDKGSPVA